MPTLKLKLPRIRDSKKNRSVLEGTLNGHEIKIVAKNNSKELRSLMVYLFTCDNVNVTFDEGRLSSKFRPQDIQS